MRESRLIHLRPDQVSNRKFSTKDPRQQVQSLRTRDRTLQRKETQRRATAQQESRDAANTVKALNDKYAGSGTNFVQNGFIRNGPRTISEVTPFNADGTRTVVSGSRLDRGSLTAYQKKLEVKYADLLKEREARRRGIEVEMDSAVAQEQDAGFDGSQAGYKYSDQLASFDEETKSIRDGVATAEGPTTGGSKAKLSGSSSPSARIGLDGASGTTTSPQRDPTRTSSPTTTDGQTPSVEGDLPTSLQGLTDEENDAILPILKSLRQQKKNAKASGGAQAKILDQRQGQVDAFAANSRITNEQIYQEKLRTALDARDFESDLLEESLERERRDEELAQQKIDNDFRRLEERQIEENILEESRIRTQLGARYGGFGSGKGIRIIHDSIRESNRLVREIGEDKIQATKEHRKRLSDLETTHRLGIRDIMVRHDASISQALQTALTTAMGIDEKELDEEEEILDDAKSLVKDVFTQLDSIEEKTGTELTKANQRALERKEALRVEANAEKATKKKDALDFYADVLERYGNTNPAAMQNALRRLEAAGYDIEGLDTGAPTIDQLQKLKDADKSTRTDPFRFDDAASQQAAATALKVVANLPNQTLQQQHLDYIYGLLDNGDVAGANEYMRGLAKSSLKGTEATEVASRDLMIESGTELIQTLNQLTKDEKNRGIYKKKWQDLQKYKLFGNQSKDPEYLEVSAQIANMAATLIKEKYGANVTEQEFARANDFIPQSSDTILDAKVKIEQLVKYLGKNNTAVLNRELGISSTGAPPVAPGADYEDENWYKGTLNGDNNFSTSLMKMGTQTQGYDTPLDPSIYPASTIKAWDDTHKGIDIAMNPDTPIQSLVSGRVKSFGYEGGYGNSLVIEADDGTIHRLSHLNDFASSISRGMRVTPGMLIALSGGAKGAKGAGNSTGPHLDYRIQYKGKYIDPSAYKPGMFSDTI